MTLVVYTLWDSMALGVDPRNAPLRGRGGLGLGKKSGPSEEEKEWIDAEDLSAGDDLLSWILVDQMGCLPDTRLGVHPQQVKFEGPKFQPSDVLRILQEVSSAKRSCKVCMPLIRSRRSLKTIACLTLQSMPCSRG